jgi:L-lactate dehydrogenase complex protein LldE
MHQQGIARRAGLDIKFVHVAQILNGGPFPQRGESIQ